MSNPRPDPFDPASLRLDQSYGINCAYKGGVASAKPLLITTVDLVHAYIKQRTALQEKEEAHKAELASMKEQLDKLSAQLLVICNEQDADSIKTSVGTVSRRVQSRYWTSDWESMYGFINDHEAAFLLEKRIHNGNMKQFLTDNSDVQPAGLQLDSKYVIQVRKPTIK